MKGLPSDAVRKQKIFKPLASNAEPPEVPVEPDASVVEERADSEDDIQAYQAKLQLSASIVEGMALHWLASVGAGPVAPKELTYDAREPIRAPRLGLGAIPAAGDMSNDSGYQVLQRQALHQQRVQHETGSQSQTHQSTSKRDQESDEEMEKGRQRKTSEVQDPFAKKKKR